MEKIGNLPLKIIQCIAFGLNVSVIEIIYVVLMLYICSHWAKVGQSFPFRFLS